MVPGIAVSALIFLSLLCSAYTPDLPPPRSVSPPLPRHHSSSTDLQHFDDPSVYSDNIQLAGRLNLLALGDAICNSELGEDDAAIEVCHTHSLIVDIELPR